MCFKIDLTFACFCDSRLLEERTYTKNFNNINQSTPAPRIICLCDNVEFSSLAFGFCFVCVSKLIKTRQKLKNVLLSIVNNRINDLFYNNSVTCFVEKRIKYDT